MGGRHESAEQGSRAAGGSHSLARRRSLPAFVFEGLPSTLRMLASSEVAAATLVAIALNLLRRERTPAA